MGDTVCPMSLSVPLAVILSGACGAKNPCAKRFGRGPIPEIVFPSAGFAVQCFARGLFANAQSDVQWPKGLLQWQA